MGLWETVTSAAKAAGTEAEVAGVEAAVVWLRTSRVRNVAILGGANCGKTSLINKIAGAEVRRPTKFSMGGEPLMVTFGSGETKAGYEVVDINSPECEKTGMSLFEIPIEQAVDHRTGQLTMMLEEMDAVIYVMSAIAPFSASDAANLEAVVNRLPMMLFVSRTDLMDSAEDSVEALGYIAEEFAGRFAGVECEILDACQPDAADRILDAIKEISLGELREFHIMRLEQWARDITAKGLRLQIRQREKERASDDAEYRRRLLEWDELRLQMLERKQKAVDVMNREITKSKPVVVEELVRQLKAADDRRQWLCSGLKKTLEMELCTISGAVAGTVKGTADLDAAWLADEVSRKFELKISMADMEGENAVHVREESAQTVMMPKQDNLIAAAGSGFIAGGALLSGMPLLPTCAVAVPAVWAMRYFVRKNREEQAEYDEKFEQAVRDCCDRNFAALAGQFRTVIDTYYDAIVEMMRDLDIRREPGNVPGGIGEEQQKLSGMLERLVQEK